MLNQNIELKNKETITISTDDGATFPDGKATFISGQQVELIIKISGNTQFKSTDKITLLPENDWMKLVSSNKTKISQDKKSATAKFDVEISLDKKYWGIRKLTVATTNISNYPAKTFSYLVSDLDTNTLSLNPDKLYIEVSNETNEPSLENTNRILASTIVKDRKGNAIPNLSINISSNEQMNLSKVKLMDSSGATIPVQSDLFSGSQYINLITDSDGNLQFYIFPQQNKLLLNLYSGIAGTANVFISKQPIFILDIKYAQFKEHLGAPDILQLNNNILSPIEDEKNLSIKIPEYLNPNPDDYILYIINDKISDNYNKVLDVRNLGKYSYQLPYSALTMSDKEIKFGYLLVMDNLDSFYSYKIVFLYEWGPSGPSENQRKLQPPTVYSSFGIDPSNIIPMNDMVNYTTISQYLFNGDTGLFVEVEADSTDANKVNPGDTVTVELIIKSSNKGPINSTYTITMPLSAPHTTTSKGHASISGDLLNNLGADSDGGGQTTLYIDYYKGISKKTGTYSKKWQAYIDTL